MSAADPDRAPDRVWWTADELAAAALPGVPASKRRVNALAARDRWRAQAGLARRRPGRGGGWEYHWTLLPLAARKALLARRTLARQPEPEAADRGAEWAAFEALPEAARARAAERLETVQAVEAMEAGGVGRDAAVEQVARLRGVAPRTVWRWMRLVDGVRTDDRLPALAPRHRDAARAARTSEIDPGFMDDLKKEYLRPERPSFTSCYRRVARVARAEGIACPTEATARRRLYAEVPRTSRIFARQGVEALKRMYPPQRRDKRSLHPMEAVNADYHKFDVFVAWPGRETPVRPQMVAFQDIYSGRLLSWRVSLAPNKTDVALALGDMVERFGIPEKALLDNGREFANKFLTGQATTRHRFRIRDDDIQGLLVTLGVDIVWATPYSGQSKPIERAFRDLCDDVAKDPRFAGAYTGNAPDAKPENYGSKAVPLERFLHVVAEGIEAHNARPGRRSDTCRGRSFIETFDAAYATAPIRKATEEQRRMWLMGAEGLRGDRRTGQLVFEGNVYWSEWMHVIAAERVIARFDPADLWAGLHVYALDGRYLGHAACREKVGFFDVDEARTHARARRDWMNAERRAAEAAKRLGVAEFGRRLDAAAPPPAEPVEAQVLRPVFPAPARPEPAPDPAAEAAHEALIARHSGEVSDIAAHRPAPAARDEALERFRAALEIEARLAADEPVRPEQRRWLERYRQQAEYRSYRTILDTHGADAIG